MRIAYFPQHWGGQWTLPILIREELGFDIQPTLFIVGITILCGSVRLQPNAQFLEDATNRIDATTDGLDVDCIVLDNDKGMAVDVDLDTPWRILV